MTHHVYKSIEITGASSESVDDAIKVAIARTSKTVKELKWFEVTEIRGRVTDEEIEQFQVTLKVGFELTE